MRPKASLGQNFLSDVGTARAVVVHGQIGPDAPVLEVGPGRGFLTRYLLESGAQVTAVEKDTRLAASLQEAGHSGQLTVVEADFTTLDLAPYEGRILVGNLPYNMSLVILRHALAVHSFWPRLVFMFQAEVARRLCAEPGSKQYGIPSVMTALTHSASVVRKVPPGAFFPRPKIDSALVLFEPLPRPLCSGQMREPFLSFVADTFKYRRKTSSNAMSRAANMPARDVSSALLECGVAPMARPETVGPAKLLQVWQHLFPPPV
jgi:16S rRNA (adenine1518-N6/adenine1519-N6)-dimethyltransferase